MISIDVLVNGKFVARGEVVVIEESFGIRVTEIIKSRALLGLSGLLSLLFLFLLVSLRRNKSIHQRVRKFDRIQLHDITVYQIINP